MATETQTHPLIQRPLRGSRISTFYPVKSLPALSSLDSAFQLQEYISLLIRLDVHDVETITSLPGGIKDAKEREPKENFDQEVKGDGGEDKEAEGEKEKDEKDVTVDEACWIYEQLRRLAQDLTHPLITTLQQECSRATCPEMKAGEWLYLCVAHGNEGAMEQCCAIDYILHTLDSATALLNSPRAFPSRLQIPASSHRHFSSLARRLGRIFAHAYFHHREAFEQAEAESSLYARFLALTSKFDLVPSEFLVIPTHTDDEDEDEEHSRDSGFSLREVKLGTSYDPRRGQGHPSLQQHQLPNSFQDEFPDVPRSRRLPQYQQQHQQQQQQPTSETQLQAQPGASGAESPKKMGRNRTHTMVLSEAAGVVDDLARAAAAAKAEDERQRKEQEEREAREQEAKERETKEKEQAQAELVDREEEATADAEEGEQPKDELERAPTQDGGEPEGAIESSAPEERLIGDRGLEGDAAINTDTDSSTEAATVVDAGTEHGNERVVEGPAASGGQMGEPEEESGDSSEEDLGGGEVVEEEVRSANDVDTTSEDRSEEVVEGKIEVESETAKGAT